MKNKLIPLALGLVASLGLAACGPKPVPDRSSSTTPVPTQTPTPSPSVSATPDPNSFLTNADCVPSIVTKAFVQSCKWTIEYAAHPVGISYSLPPPTYGQFMSLEKAGSAVMNQFVTDVNDGNGGKYLNSPYDPTMYEGLNGAATVTDSSPGCVENVPPITMGGVYTFSGTFYFAAYQVSSPIEYANCEGKKLQINPASAPNWGFWVLTSTGLLQQGTVAACTLGVGYSPSGCAWQKYINSLPTAKATG